MKAKKDPQQVNENTNALPDQLKAGIQELSGLSMDDVTVHHNSSIPDHLNASAYLKGDEIHAAENQLPHEAWHVIQQTTGRVAATRAITGAKLNNDSSLEHEADKMGAKADEV